MLTVEQVQRLDNKVKSALDLIEKLRNENSMLKSKLGEYENRVEQLEKVVDGFKLEQLEIEEGIKDVLNQLDQLEDQITSPAKEPVKEFSQQEYTGNESNLSMQEMEDHSPEPETSAPEPFEAETVNNSSFKEPPELEIF